jgi:anti-sigma factor RsiW
MRLSLRLSDRRCNDAQTFLPAFVEGELTAAESHRVAGHIAVCGHCRQEAAAYRQAMGFLHTQSRPAAPGDLYAGFAAKLAQQEMPRRYRPTALRWAGAAACLLLMLGAGAAVYRALPSAAPVQVAQETPLPHTRTVGNPVSSGSVPTAPTAVVPLSVPENVASGAPTREPVRLNPNPPAPPRSDPFAGTPSVRHKAERVASRPDKPTKAVPAPQETADAGNGFLSVRPKSGLSAAEQLRLARRAEEAEAKSGPPLRRTPRVAAIVADSDETVRVGDRVTRIQTSSGYDRTGRRVLIGVNIGTSGASEAPEPARETAPELPL